MLDGICKSLHRFDTIIENFKNNRVLKMLRRNQLLSDLRSISLYKASSNIDKLLRITVGMSNLQLCASTHKLQKASK